VTLVPDTANREPRFTIIYHGVFIMNFIRCCYIDIKYFFFPPTARELEAKLIKLLEEHDS